MTSLSRYSQSGSTSRTTRNLKSQDTLRILKRPELACKEDSYINTFESQNKSRVTKVLSGMKDLNQLHHLQITGQNQLQKEIMETKNLKKKYYAIGALHRNEMTHEYERPSESEMREHYNEEDSEYSSDSSRYSNCIDDEVNLRKLEYGVNSQKCTVNKYIEQNFEANNSLV